MPLFDDRGHLFGRINLIDAAVAIVVLLFIPLSYGAYQLFRTPVPEILAVEPGTLVQGNDLTVTVEGKNLQPFLRATVDNQEAVLVVEDPTQAKVTLSELTRPGVHDLVLYDVSREVARYPAAVVLAAPVRTIPESPTLEIRVLGAFTGLELESAAMPAESETFGTQGESGSGEVLAVAPAEREVMQLAGGSSVARRDGDKVRVVALVRVRCALIGNDCSVGGTTVAPGAVLTLVRQAGSFPFDVMERYRPPTELQAEVTVMGAFVGLDEARAERISSLGESSDAFLESWGRILSLGRPEPENVGLSGGVHAGTTGKRSIRALVALRCAFLNRDCRLGSTIIAPEARLAIPTRQGIAWFEVAEIYPAAMTSFPPPPPTLEIRVLGAFTGLELESAAMPAESETFGTQGESGSGEVLAVAPAEREVMQLAGGSSVARRDGDKVRVVALVRVRCALIGNDCSVGGTTVAPGAVLTLVRQAGSFPFDVMERYRPPTELQAEVTVMGAFVGLDEARAERISSLGESSDTSSESWGRILSLGRPEPENVRLSGGVYAGTTGKRSIRALVAIRCAIVGHECRLGSKEVRVGIDLAIPTREGIAWFEVAEIYPGATERLVELKVAGAFVALDRDQAQRLAATAVSDQPNQPWGKVLALGPPEPEIVVLAEDSGPVGAGTTGKFKVDALVAVRCVVAGTGCRLGSTTIGPESMLSVPTTEGLLLFDAAEIQPAETTLVDVTVRCATEQRILSLVKNELLTRDAEAQQGRYAPARVTLLAFSGVEEETTLRTSYGAYTWEHPGVVFSVVLRVPAPRTALGTDHFNPLRAGETFRYAHPSYVLAGVISRVEVASTEERDAGRQGLAR